MYRKILVPLSNAASSLDAALDAAIYFGRIFGSRVEVLYARPSPEALILVLGKGFAGTMLENALREVQAKIARDCQSAHDRMTGICGQASRSQAEGAATGREPEVVWREVEGPADRMVGTEGRFADLILFAKPKIDGVTDSVWRSMFDAALFGSARPVMVTPFSPIRPIGSKIMIAWNGSPQATRAVVAALPLLRRAQDVLIGTFGSDEDLHADSERLRDYLLIQGVDAQTEHLPKSLRETGGVLLAMSAQFGADLLVMGGHGRNRLRQWALGSTTSHVVALAAIPVLMVH
ncbi:universal stress protein [Azospirillum endophyticum]